jgi:putative hydrolase of the HAD superfamily
VTTLDAIFFDLDDTLFPTTAFARRARRNAVKAMVEAGLDLPEEMVYRELQEVIAEFTSNYTHHYDHLIKRLGQSIGTNINPALIIAAGMAAYHDTKFLEIAPYEDVPSLLADLKAAGLIVGIITHGWTVKQAEKLLRLGLIPHLDPRAIFISEQVGISKPNPKLYSVALEALDLDPTRTMYVGDNPGHDVIPPKKLGMIATWASRGARHTLKETGVEADHEVANFRQLRKILRSEYEVDI